MCTRRCVEARYCMQTHEQGAPVIQSLGIAQYKKAKRENSSKYVMKNTRMKRPHGRLSLKHEMGTDTE